ncbi:hypothetical protein V866_004020 [Kwoniella sp. B9012]
MAAERAPACPGGSPSPVVFPPRPSIPLTSRYEYALNYTDIGGSSSTFPVRIFNAYTTSVGFASNGYLRFTYYTVAPYQTALGSWPTSGDYALSQFTNHTFTYTWQSSLASDIRQRIGFTLYYTTDTPGIFYIWYDYVLSKTTGDQALIGAYGSGFSKPYNITYSQNTPGKIHAGMRLAFDTNCNGSSITVG